jgi:hypothetical protein
MGTPDRIFINLSFNPTRNAMKAYVYKGWFILAVLVISLTASAQNKISNVEFEAEQTEILRSTSTSYGEGTLSSGEPVTTECRKGTCYLSIDYKGRMIEAPIGESITNATVYEFDFGGDEDKELIVVNDHKGTSYLHVFAYARGIIQPLFMKEIFNNRTVIQKNYILLYSPGGLNMVWNYYQGSFWSMKEEEF